MANIKALLFCLLKKKNNKKWLKSRKWLGQAPKSGFPKTAFKRLESTNQEMSTLWQKIMSQFQCLKQNPLLRRPFKSQWRPWRKLNFLHIKKKLSRVNFHHHSFKVLWVPCNLAPPTTACLTSWLSFLVDVLKCQSASNSNS